VNQIAIFRAVATRARPRRRCPALAHRTGIGERLDEASPTRLRVHLDQTEIRDLKTCVGVLSRANVARSVAATSWRLDFTSMSMKSITMIPPISRSRSCEPISSPLQRLFLKTVSSRLEDPTFFPVLTSRPSAPRCAR